MKVKLIGLMYGVFEKALEREKIIFRDLPIIQFLDDMIVEVKKETSPYAFIKNTIDAEIALLNFEAVSSENHFLKLCISKKKEVQQLEKAFLEDSNQAANIKKHESSLVQLFKVERQRYWLAWLEDFLCEATILACNQAYQSLPSKAESYLFVVTYPEFTFVDLTRADLTVPIGTNVFDAFYMNVMTEFIEGSLMDFNPRRPKLPCSHLCFLEQYLQIPSGKPNLRVLLVAGTFIWKIPTEITDIVLHGDTEAEIEENAIQGWDPFETGTPIYTITKLRSTFFNTALVFWDNACIFAWDKQLISDADGKSYMASHQHLVTLTDTGENPSLTIPPGEVCMASLFTKSIMGDRIPSMIKPVFRIHVFNENIVCGLTICKDMARSDMLGPGYPVDIHILVGFGAAMDPNDDRCKAESLYLVCDGAFGGFISMISRHNPAFWPAGDTTREWNHIITKAWLNTTQMESSDQTLLLIARDTADLKGSGL